MRFAHLPRRSLLYIPGSNQRALSKGKSLGADGLILDLEDSVAPDAKIQAREQVIQAVTEGYGKREILIRINGLDTPWGLDDLIAAGSSGADGIVLPKVDGADSVRHIDALLKENGAPDHLALWCMMETPRGILHAEEIVDSSPRLGGLVMGTNDLAKELHCFHTPMRLPMLTSLGTCILAARAARLPIVDGVYPDLSDEEGFRASCLQGVEFGFDGKTLIHPKTIDIANEVFSPSEEELARAHKIVAAFEEALDQGKAVVLVDGKLVESLHVENAKRLIELAKSIEERQG